MAKTSRRKALIPDRTPMSQLGKLSVWWWLAITLLLLAALTPFDREIYHALRDPDFERSDLSQLLRTMGYLPAWLLAAGAVLLADRRNANTTHDERVTRAGVFFLAPGLAGAGAELLKLLSGRMRPEVGDGLYTFKPLLHGFVDGSNLGFASSHAAVAMGGALIASYRCPRLAYVLVPLALGCGASRLVVGAHFATDVVAGFGIAALVAWWLRDAVVAGPSRAGVNS